MREDGDEFSFDPVSRRLTQRDARQRPTTRLPLTPKEDEIRRSGGIVAVGRREFRQSVERAPVDRVPGRGARALDDDDRADRLGAPCGQGSRAS